MKILSENLENTKAFAEEFINSLRPSDKATIISLRGDLGSGKTTFSQFVGRSLGVEEHIQSPTFLIEKVYELQGRRWKRFVHIDAYRLESAEELLHLGWNELAEDKENLVFIEWPEKVQGIIPDYAYRIEFSHVAENTRQIEVKEPKG